MADGFEHMIDEALAFFAELEVNNTREWFEPRKARYVAEIKKPAELLGDLIAEDLARITGRAHKPKLFRIHRDVRFSKDKTPYNPHLHLLWSDPAGDALVPGYFFGLSKMYLMMGAGMMSLSGDALTRFRAHIDAHGAALETALEEAAPAGVTVSNWGPKPLKRVPKPYDADHPQADLLKRKSLTLNADLPSDWREAGLVKSILGRIADLRPVTQAMTPR